MISAMTNRYSVPFICPLINFLPHSTFHKAGDAHSAIWRAVGINFLQSTHFSSCIAPHVKVNK